MKLLNVHTGEIHEFLSDTDVEPYAILSHTWAEDEVTFEDLQSLPKETLAAKKGFAKIYHCCVQAAADGYGWAWVDTCCIDKRSSAELSEAINCMFRWYKNAAICYVYFADVQAHATGLGDIHHELACARWFTRGWTLQELLASREMVLYSRDWKRIGTKHDLAINLAWITGIEVKYLRGVVSLATASVSKRMSWAAQRSTSRTEDIAYCLLGIFDINMPLLYGEGKKAFRRLQEEILKANPADHTLLAWGRIVSCPPMRWVDDAPQLYGYKYIPWDEAEASQTLRGLFAESPKDFQHSAGLLPLPRAGGRYDSSLISLNRPMTPAVYPTITGAGVMLELFTHALALPRQFSYLSIPGVWSYSAGWTSSC
ncbi:heterokaryon incompatibility protein-domain-containing protein [Chaetomidium leptoderma]|uniref:Heterokaryon incompatibility protein-domain-containing protein n=1 Tax=Chaetomidium leptoderma TaxID=669021 RepID=A0AAN6VTY4_9PEZI|nr:heterokaryon incompatibility protein-domain-containing protein [Chaetomidium leptoderma]